MNPSVFGGNMSEGIMHPVVKQIFDRVAQAVAWDRQVDISEIGGTDLTGMGPNVRAVADHIAIACDTTIEPSKETTVDDLVRQIISITAM